MERIFKNAFCSRALAELRDAQLPKLPSGEHSVLNGTRKPLGSNDK